MVRNKEYKRVCDLLEEARRMISFYTDTISALRLEATDHYCTIDRLKTECADLRSIVQELLGEKRQYFDPCAPTIRILHFDHVRLETRTYEFKNPLYAPFGEPQNSIDCTQRIEPNLPKSEEQHD